jgi:dUTP pyrophosphatase
MKLNVKIKRLNEAAVIPKYAHDGDAGVDLIATEDIIIEPGQTKLVPTGIAVSIPPGFEAQVRPRSGITLRTKLRVALGTIDAGYTGEIGVIVDNIAPQSYRTGHVLKTVDGKAELTGGLTRFLDENTYIVRKGERIAQLVFAPIETAHFVDADKLEETMRGINGYGSTGTKKEAE